MATQEGCPEAHKAVKQKLIETLEQELLDTISNIDQPPHTEVDAPSTIPTPNTPFTAITNLLERMEKSRNENNLIQAWLNYSSERLDPTFSVSKKVFEPCSEDDKNKIKTISRNLMEKIQDQQQINTIQKLINECDQDN